MNDIFDALYAYDAIAVETFLRTGSSIEALNSDGNTPLLHALSDAADINGPAMFISNRGLGNPEKVRRTRVLIDIIRGLISQGANVDAARVHGFLLALPGVSGSGFSALHNAATWGNPEILKLLLSKTKHVDPKTSHGTTPLTIAAFKGHVDAVRLLIAAHADVNARDERGTVLERAIACKHHEVAKILMAAGAR